MASRLIKFLAFIGPRRLQPLFSTPAFLAAFSLNSSFFRKSSGLSAMELPYDIRRIFAGHHVWVHSSPLLTDQKGLESLDFHGNDVGDDFSTSKMKRKRPKGKRAVVKWLKFFRWRKEKEYERMTAEEKILYKLRKARRKEERLVEALRKIEPKDSSEPTHDPEILTPEEHFYFLKMGQKCKNYVPVGRRGIYQGVILNMHLHWKKHQTLQVVVKTFTAEEVKEMAAELARLSGGIVLDIQEDHTIIMYRGKNYIQPPTEIMSPRTTLPRKKALDKSKYRDGLRSVRRYIPQLEKELDLLRAKAENKAFGENEVSETPVVNGTSSSRLSSFPSDDCEKVKEKVKEALGADVGSFEEDDDSDLDSALDSDSEEALSDIFQTDYDSEDEREAERPLFLNTFEKFPSRNDGDTEDLDSHLRRASNNEPGLTKAPNKDLDSPDFDEVDSMFLRAASLLKKKRK